MLTYQNPITIKNNIILSVDNIILDLYLSNQVHREHFMRLLEQLPFQYTADVDHWTNFRLGTYREQFSIKLGDCRSFWVGAGLNLSKTKWGSVRLDFNPNKVAGSEVFQAVQGYLVRHTRYMHRKIRRYDLAVDIPIDRQSVYLLKDARAYYERRHGQEWTQYLGPRSAHGRVKVYNKQLEAKLGNLPLTRLELTIDPAIPYEKIKFPTVYYLDEMQMDFEDLKATDTEKFILNAILQGCGTTKQLGRRMQQKLELLLSKYVKYITISKTEYRAILNELQRYTVGQYEGGVYKPSGPAMWKMPETVAEFQYDESSKEISPFETM